VYLIQHYVIMFVWLATGQWFSLGTQCFLHRYNWNIVESGVKHPNANLTMTHTVFSTQIVKLTLHEFNHVYSIIHLKILQRLLRAVSKPSGISIQSSFCWIFLLYKLVDFVGTTKSPYLVCHEAQIFLFLGSIQQHYLYMYWRNGCSVWWKSVFTYVIYR
jgi:hypothetical protein